MSKKSDNKKQIEAVFDERIGEEAILSGIFTYAVAMSNRTGGSITHRHYGGQLPNICYRSTVMDVSGFTSTGPNGNTSFELSTCICPLDEKFNFPNIVVTPYGSQPFLLTAMATLINNGKDIKIEVFSWDTDGHYAKNVQFYWRVRVQPYV